MKVIATILIGIPLFLGGILGLNYFGFANIAFFAPKYEGVRRDVMIESRHYSEATVRELYRLKRQYDEADSDAARNTIVATARHEFSIFPVERLPNDLAMWHSQINR